VVRLSVGAHGDMRASQSSRMGQSLRPANPGNLAIKAAVGKDSVIKKDATNAF
jgi:hypothetical protein